jgi:K+-sensing histidine kinase KdpD
MMNTEQRNGWIAVGVGLVAPIGLAAVLIPVRDAIGNTNIALILMAVVVAVAATGRRLAATVAAFSAAGAYDFFQTEPYYSFSIHHREDLISVVFLMIAGLVVCQVAIWGRGQRTHAERTLSEISALRTIADLVATGESQATVVDTASFWLRELLGLRDCRYEGAAGQETPALLSLDGTVTIGELRWSAASQGLPGPAVYLPVRHDREVIGYFVLTPTTGATVSEDRLYTATAIADQVGGMHVDHPGVEAKVR